LFQGSIERIDARLSVTGLGEFPLKPANTLGRGPDCDIVLNVSSVSRHHARIFLEGGHYWVKDLESGNGTVVNGERVKLQMLNDGDTITLGQAQAVFHASEAKPEPAPFRDRSPGADLMEGFGQPAAGWDDEKHPTLPPRGTPMEPWVGPKDHAVAAGSQASEPGSQFRSTSIQDGGASSLSETTRLLEQENQRLKKLVAQLERALADSNTRIRNLQERIDKAK